MRPKNNNYHQQHEYDHYTVGKPAPLLEWLLANIKGESKTKIKQTLQGRGIKVDGNAISSKYSVAGRVTVLKDVPVNISKRNLVIADKSRPPTNVLTLRNTNS